MAVRIRLGDYETQQGDPLGRTYIGYFPRMTEAEAWEAGRGVWKMNRARAAAERFALIVGEGRVRAIAELAGVTEHDDRIALDGKPLSPGHPLYDTYLGVSDPLANDSRNSITYGDLPEEAQFKNRPCACGCGQITERDFAPGHELRAIQARIREHFGGSALTFIQWIDKHVTTAPAPAGKKDS